MPEYAGMHKSFLDYFFVGASSDGPPDIAKARCHIAQSVRITLLMLALCEKRAPNERFLLIIADSWSCAAPNMAWICAICDFKMHIGLKESDARAVFSTDGEGDAFFKLLEDNEPRFKGLWIIVTSSSWSLLPLRRRMPMMGKRTNSHLHL